MTPTTRKIFEHMNSEDSFSLRQALGTFLTGVTIVAARDQDGAPRGLTVNSFTSVSLNPPLLLVCVHKRSPCLTAFETSGGFAISVLAESQRRAAEIFAGKTADRFDRVAHFDCASGLPIIEGAAAWFDCATKSTIDGGDHIVLIGEVRTFEGSNKPGLGYAAGGYAVAQPIPSQPTYLDALKRIQETG